MIWTDQEPRQAGSSSTPPQAAAASPAISRYDQPTIGPVSDEQERAWKLKRLEALDLSPFDSAFDADESETFGTFWVVYAIAHGIKQGIYNPLKRWFLDEKPQYIDSEGHLQTWEGPVDHTEALGAIAQIGMLFLPGGEATTIEENLTLGSGKIAEEEVLKVAANREAWGQLTAGSPPASQIFSMGQDLSAMEELAIIDHGTARNVLAMARGEVGAEQVILSGVGKVGPNTLAELMAQSGWQGGYIRLISCGAGMSSESGLIFGEQLSIALGERGLPTVVAAPTGLVQVGSTLGATQAPVILAHPYRVGVSVFDYFGP
jgi:hypothetical protein